jgi:hypothetical protein
MSTSTEPQLDAPGGGLPAPELLIAKNLFALKSRSGSREAFLENFAEERAEIGRLLASCPEVQRGERVLIARQRGMEDSSRHWSVWMTLDHLRIINTGIASFITELTDGRVPANPVSTADVKPNPGVGADIEADFEQSCDDFVQVIEQRQDLKTKVKFDHPWFGPLDAYRWLGLASEHMAIHRRQIAAIVDGLSK